MAWSVWLASGRGSTVVAAALLSLAAGCATTATRPPTPAARVRFEELEREPVPPNERYYCLIFGSQSHPKIPRFTHTWATDVRVTDRGPGLPPALDYQTISWYPASMVVRPWRFRVEPGVNLDLEATLHEVLRHRERVSVWGPYEIRPGIYRKFLLQKEFMESGQIGYQCVDTLGEAARAGNGCDCIHAITDADAMFARDYYPLRRFGDTASEYIVAQIVERGAVIDPEHTHDWLIPALGLDRYPIHRRCYQRRGTTSSAPGVDTAGGGSTAARHGPGR
jgi:hypothetical protein